MIYLDFVERLGRYRVRERLMSDRGRICFRAGVIYLNPEFDREYGLTLCHELVHDFNHDMGLPESEGSVEAEAREFYETYHKRVDRFLGRLLRQ